MTIDVHGHVTPPELLRKFPMPPSLGDIDGMLARKATLDITTTVVGSPVGYGTMLPVPGNDNYAQPADSLARFHEWVAETVRAKAGALAGYVYANPFAADDVARAAEWLREPEFSGLIVNTSVRGEFLNDARTDEFFAMAAERRAPVLLHPPAAPVGADAVGSVGAVEHVARPCDITMGVAAILLAGRLARFPGLTLIAPNAGGALALLAEKLDMAQQRDNPDTDLPVSAQLREIYVDTATPSLPALRAAVEVFGPDRMLFGTDSPPLATSLDAALAAVDALGLSDVDRAKVLRGNATTLFGVADTELRRAS